MENVGYDSATDLQLTDVLEYGSWDTDNLTVMTSPYKLGADATKHYRVIYDKGYGTKTNPGKVCSYELDTADFPSNHRLNVFAISDYVTGVAPPTLTILCRNRYKDC